ncbi:MAG TPA: sugar phosphate nucleotidyltransferase [Candidatus Omnitrophota bacterium]|nr:sugar phosphate nucleotidyltransferase [Candidatus Omnitrophota bacterium]
MEPQDVDLIILCGGIGKRLKPVTDKIPKPMVTIGQSPFLEILINSIAPYGFEKFILATGYKGEIIEQYFQKRKGLSLHFSREKTALGTAGAVKNCEPFLKNPFFLVLNGDSFCPVDYHSLLEFHEQNKVLATAVVTPDDRSRTDAGSIKIGLDRQILSFCEKEPGNYLNAGIYVFTRRILEQIPSGRSFSFEKDLFPSLSPDEFYAYVNPEKLYDIGTPERLKEFQKIYSQWKTSSPE